LRLNLISLYLSRKS